MKSAPLSTLIIEDEQPSARRLKRMLEGYNMDIVAMLPSVETAVEWFSTNDAPDLIFLDIQLSDGLSFEIFEHVSIQSFVIFTSAYNQYAIKAFELNSVDYLLKPIDPKDLERAVNKLYTLNERIAPSVDMDSIKRMIMEASGQRPSYKARFSIKVGQRIKMVAAADIACFYSENKSSWIRTTEGRSYPLDYSMDELEGLVDPELFHRVSRRYIVHIEHIEEIHQYTNSRLRILIKPFKEADIIVSRERVKVFKEWLG